MRKLIPLTVWAFAVFIVTAPITAQVQRDPTQPTTRVVPVGTATITGTVVDAESGRPLAGARISVLGDVPQREPGPAPTRGGGPGVQAGLSMSLGPTSQMPGSPGRAARGAVTDAQGVFEVRHLPPGRYIVSVNHRGYLNGSVGQKKPAGRGTAFEVIDGGKVPVTIKMIRGGVIAGAVYGENGDPLPNAQVALYRYQFNSGVRRLQQSGGLSTDDRGLYRFHGLQPGDYFVSATDFDYYSRDTSQAEMALIESAVAAGAIRPPVAAGLPATVSIPTVANPGAGVFNQPPGYLPTYFPSATSPAAARTIRVVGGDEHPGVDISVRLVTASSVEGVITNPPGADMRVQIQVMSDDPTFVYRGGAQTRPEGNFFVSNLAPGTYTLAAITSPVRAGMSGPPTEADLAASLWGRTTVTVTGEPRVTTSLTLQAGRTISGRVAFEMARPPDLSQQTVTVRLSTAPGSIMGGGPQLSARVGADGRFAIRGVPAGRFVLNVSGPSTRSAMVRGQDVMDFPLEFDGGEDLTDVVVTVTDQLSELTGTFTPAEGMNTADALVLVAPTDERYWLPGGRRIVVTQLNPSGVYRVRGLPAGSYFISIVTDLEQGSQYDPALLKELLTTSGVQVTMSEGGKVTRDLRASGG